MHHKSQNHRFQPFSGSFPCAAEEPVLLQTALQIQRRVLTMSLRLLFAGRTLQLTGLLAPLALCESSAIPLRVVAVALQMAC